jgi:hypothetical protein
MNKPKFLYHGSPDKNIQLFKPRAVTKPKNFKKGPVVFATDDFVNALKFLVPSDDSWTKKGSFFGVHFCVIKDIKRFKKLDKGGSLYKLPSDSFVHYKFHEWYSQKTVKPLSKKDFKSGFEAMIDNHVQVYVVDNEIFKRIEKAKDHGASILNKIKSENEKGGLEIKKLRI